MEKSPRQNLPAGNFCRGIFCRTAAQKKKSQQPVVLEF
jgi:hypothetical protein